MDLHQQSAQPQFLARACELAYKHPTLARAWAIAAYKLAFFMDDVQTANSAWALLWALDMMEYRRKETRK